MRCLGQASPLHNRVAWTDDGGVRFQQQAELGRRDPQLGDAGVLQRGAGGGGRERSGSTVSRSFV